MRTTLLGAVFMIAMGVLLNSFIDQGNRLDSTRASTKKVYANLPTCFGYEASCVFVSGDALVRNDLEDVKLTDDTDDNLITASLNKPDNSDSFKEDDLNTKTNHTSIVHTTNYELGGLINEYEARQKIKSYPALPHLPTPRTSSVN